VPESPAGEILFARAETLADLQQFEEALKAAELLEAEDWNQKRRLLVAPLKVKCLAGLNRFEEAMLIAKQMEEQSKDSSIVAFVQLVLGEVEFGRTNYPAALDHFLYNRVFNPTLKEEAGRGLWNASRVYLAETNFSAAVRVLQDIITDYPQSSVFARAQTKLKELQPLVKTETNEEKEENEPNQEQETTTQ
jgi:tetratricopeptide (TPR) repeat protein